MPKSRARARTSAPSALEPVSSVHRTTEGKEENLHWSPPAHTPCRKRGNGGRIGRLSSDRASVRSDTGPHAQNIDIFPLHKLPERKPLRTCAPQDLPDLRGTPQSWRFRLCLHLDIAVPHTWTDRFLSLRPDVPRYPDSPGPETLPSGLSRPPCTAQRDRPNRKVVSPVARELGN